ncbi:MAG: hypothetical protein ACO1TE_12850 [Prosthecobacter sp.]
MKTMDQRRKNRRGCGCAFVIALLGVWLWLGMASYPNEQTTANQVKTVSNGRQVIIALRQYAELTGGKFPDAVGKGPKSSNDVFRELFKEGIVTDERIFTGMRSRFVPDNKIGDPPDFKEALVPGECHWMLLKHQTPQSHPDTPILIENAINASWPPRWSELPPAGFSWFGLKKPATRERGQTWRGRMIVVVRLDGSAAVEKSRADGTLDWESPRNAAWLRSLTPEQIAKLEYWDVEEKKQP